jgi:hypothetical protein
MTPTTVRDNLKALSAYLYESSGPDFMYEAVEQAIVLLEGWRPIESAPKDGTRILCYLHNARNPKVQIMRWHQPGNPEKAGYWIGADWPSDASRSTAVWQPLPEPPK